jgi:hypothetical protein
VRSTPQLSTRRARGRYVLLYQLATHQQTLLYYVLINNLEELAPIVYTPTVGVIPNLTLTYPSPTLTAPMFLHALNASQWRRSSRVSGVSSVLWHPAPSAQARGAAGAGRAACPGRAHDRVLALSRMRAGTRRRGVPEV